MGCLVSFYYSKTCVRELPSRLTLNSGWCGKSCLSYKGTCHVILLAKLHDMYLYKTTTFPHQPLRSISKVAVLHRFYCITFFPEFNASSVGPDQTLRSVASDLALHCCVNIYGSINYPQGHENVNANCTDLFSNVSPGGSKFIFFYFRPYFSKG